MFDNHFANIAFEKFDGKRVLWHGKNIFGEPRPDWNKYGVAKVFQRWQGPFGGMRYCILVNFDDSNVETGDINTYYHGVNTEEELSIVMSDIELVC